MISEQVYKEVFLFFLILWLHRWHMEVPGPGTDSEAQLWATLDPLTHCARRRSNPDLHSDLSHCGWILNPRRHSRNSVFFIFLTKEFRRKTSTPCPFSRWTANRCLGAKKKYNLRKGHKVQN